MKKQSRKDLRSIKTSNMSKVLQCCDIMMSLNCSTFDMSRCKLLFFQLRGKGKRFFVMSMFSKFLLGETTFVTSSFLPKATKATLSKKISFFLKPETKNLSELQIKCVCVGGGGGG